VKNVIAKKECGGKVFSIAFRSLHRGGIISTVFHYLCICFFLSQNDQV
jgi:hypothetical protein